MLPEAKNEDLLYVSNVYTITVYSYPKGKLVGTLDNFYKPYDLKGNLYVDGLFGSYGDGFLFGELAKGGGEIKDILLPNSISFPGGIEWDGQYVAVGDNAGEAIYQYTLRNGSATLEGTTPLTAAGNVGQFAIVRSTVVTPDQFFSKSGSGVLYYSYPGGGASTHTITNGVFYPYSAVISPWRTAASAILR